ncbi:MAG TPA: S53 family peptidase [Candidatus Tumulicola sp.]|jgi:kumamolisin
MRFHNCEVRVLAAAAMLSMLAACGGGGSNFSPSAAGGASAMDSLRAPMPGPISTWKDLGRAGDATRVHVSVVLKYRNEAQLDALVDGQGDPDSAFFGHFLTPGQFARSYGPTAKDYTATQAALRDGGFSIDHTFPNRTVIEANASAPVAEKFFATKIDLVRRGDGSVRYREVQPDTMPASLANTVLTVVGLDNSVQLHPDYVFKAGHKEVHPSNLGQMHHNATAPLFGPDGGYGPEVYRVSYDFPKLTGTGRATAVVGDADFLDTDLASYLSFFQITRTGPATTRVLVDGGPPPGISGDSIETTLDVETVASIAPGTALYVYEAPQASDLHYFTDMYNQIVSDNKADTVNTSYSECETALVPSFPKAANAIFKQGAALGITFHSSTGDYGTITYGCSSSTSIGTPTDTPYNEAIGGTTEQVNHTTGQETSEIVWNNGDGATGGGVSVVFKVPSFQKGVANVINTGRNIPDISFDADPQTGESLYYRGGFDGPIGGTSLSSPIFGAGLTIMDQKRHKRAGFFNKTLYAKWIKNGYGSGKKVYFRDITSGNIPPYTAKTGYDQLSGIGAMNFKTFLSLLH